MILDGDRETLNRWVLVGLIFSLTLLLLPLSIDNLKFITLGISLLGYWCYRYIYLREVTISIPLLSFGLLLFAFLSFVSVFWALDHSMGLRDCFIWLISILLCLSIADIVRIRESTTHLLSKFLSITFIIFLVFHLGAIQFDIGLDKEWNLLMSKGKNYTTTLLTCLSPFLIFYPSRSQFVRFLKVISIILLINLLFITGARGAMLAFSMVVVLKFWDFYADKPYRYGIILAGGLVIIAAIYILNVSKSSVDFTFVDEYKKELDSRIMMNKNSITTVKNHPIGVGAGNWANFIYSYGVQDISPFNSPNEFKRYRSHNLYFKTVAETGILGLVLLLGTFMGTLWRYRYRWSHLTGYSKAAWATFLAWMVVSYFYATAISYEYFFSGIFLVAMVSLGILLSGLKSSIVTNKLNQSVFLFFSALCLIWFSYMKYTHDNHAMAVLHIKNNEPQRAVKLLVSKYHPIWHTSRDYYTSLGQLIAEQYVKLDDFRKAEVYYEQALDVAPHNENLLLSYASQLIVNQEGIKAKKLLEKILSIQPNSLQAQKLLKENNL